PDPAETPSLARRGSPDPAETLDRQVSLSPLAPHSGASITQNTFSRLRVNLRESRLLRTNLDVHSVHSLDDDICEAIQFSPREVVLVGKKQGTTRIDFWCGENEPLRASYEVTVGPNGMALQTARDQHSKLRKLIRDLHPDCAVKIESEDSKLVVSGTAKDAQEAVAIITMIRRMRTIPVVDKLVVEKK
ncbi:MAG: pilus assembly protein N-terminal domain-containing protein, partial [Pirellulales bacterium]